jgi:hypothetical protein
MSTGQEPPVLTVANELLISVDSPIHLFYHGPFQSDIVGLEFIAVWEHFSIFGLACASIWSRTEKLQS